LPRFRADWILPIVARPIRRGWVAVEDGRIGEVGGDDSDAVDLGRVALLPGLVNAHTHLELSYLHGQVGRSDTFTDWVRELLRLRRRSPGTSPADIQAAVTRAVDEARASGTVLLGDVANTLVGVPALNAARVSARVFLELIGFNVADPEARVREARQQISGAQPSDRVRISLGAHAPYSVSPGLFREIRADLDRAPGPVSCVHLAESPEEVELLGKGTGPLKALLDDLGAWDPEWRVPEASPVEYLDEIGFLDARVIAVHGVQCTGEDLRRLQTLGVTVVSCPRSNLYVGVGSPPLEAFYAMDVEVAFGTDSLASVENLHMFSELAEARRIAPRVPARRLLESATLTGARALGFGGDYGSIEPGKLAALIVVRLPDGVTDVEEYLLGGVQPADISWLEAARS